MSRIPNNRKPTITPVKPTYAGARSMTRRQLYDHIQSFQRTAPSTGGTQATTVPVPSISAGTAAPGSGGGGGSLSGGGGVALSNFVPQLVSVGGASSAGSAGDASRSDHVHAMPASGVTAGGYGSASAVGTYTVNAEGILTAAATVTIGIDGSQIISGTVVAARLPVATSGALGIVQPDGTIITDVAGAITVATATAAAKGVVQPDGTIITVTGGVITVPKASAVAFGVCEVDGTSITAVGGVLSATGGSGTSATPFAAYSAGTAYTVDQVVLGSDGNLYIAQTSTTGNSPIGDTGTHWKLWVLQANLTLNCGVGQTFADSFAASGSPGGAMVPGMTTALAFIASAVGASSPSVATVTLQQGNNPTFAASANGSTTTIKTTTNIPIGASIVGLTAHNVGTTNTVSASSFSGGTYTLTVTAWTSTVSGDTYTYAPYYGTNTITVNLPLLGPNLVINGSSSTPIAPMFYPSATLAGSSSSIAAGTYSISLTYLWTDSTGTTRETVPGWVTDVTASNGNTITLGTFTLPAWATGANVYMIKATTGTMWKQAFTGTPSTGMVITAYATSVAAPSANAPPATWPCAMMWGAASGIVVSGTEGVTVNGLYLRGASNGSGGAAGLQASTKNGVPGSFVVTTGVVVSNFASPINASGPACQFNVTLSQVDDGINGYIVGASAVGFVTSCLATNPATTASIAFIASNMATLFLSQQNFNFASTGFGYYAASGGQIRIATLVGPVSGNALPLYGVSTVSSPAINTNGNGNAFINTLF